jgi:glycosyltransferase involved in cell wall biosynthesis
MKNILWIDDYPTPVREKAIAALKTSIPDLSISAIYLNKNGSKEGRHWNFPNVVTLRSLKLFGKKIAILKKRDQNISIFCEATLPLVPTLLLNVWLGRLKNYVLIVGHVKNKESRFGTREWAKEKFRKWSTEVLVKRSIAINYYSDLSFEFCPPAPGTKYSIGYGTPIEKCTRSTDGIKSDVERANIAPSYVMVGKVNARKNFSATAKILKNIPGKREIAVIGEWEEPAEALKNFDVIFGHQQDPLKLSELRASYKFEINPALQDPWGHVVIEGMSVGLVPIVSNKVGASIAVMELDEKLVFDPNDNEDISRVISYVESMSPTEYITLSQRSRKLASKYDIDNHVNALKKII